MEVHTFCTGHLVGNSTFMRGDGFGALLKKRDHYEFPCLSFVLELDDELIAVDTGMGRHIAAQPATGRFVPRPLPGVEIGPQMCARGLDPADVRRVIVTHLDWDHVGGVHHFPHADVLVHRPEFEFAGRLPGRLRYRPQTWPDAFAPALYDLARSPYGPFPESLPIADGIVVVPLAGHSIGQVGVVVEDGATRILFAADHVLRQDWFEQDLSAGRELGLGQFFPALARETTRRISELAADVLMPSHDADAPARVAAPEAVCV